MSSGVSKRLGENIHPAILLFAGSLAGLTLGFVLLPKILEYDLVQKGADVSWETLLAGVLGLAGGSFAFLAAQHQSNQEKTQRERAFRIRLKSIVGKIQLRADNFISPNLETPMFNGYYNYDRSDQTSLEYVKAALEELPTYVPDEIVTDSLNEAHMRLRSLLKGYDHLFSQRGSVEKRNIERFFVEISEHSKAYLDQLSR